MTDGPGGFARWPLLAASVTLTGAGLALDLTNPAVSGFAAACLVLGASAFGAFVYAEGARHREWFTRSDSSLSATPDTTESDDTPGG